MQALAMTAFKIMLGLATSGGLATGAVKAWQWISTRDDVILVNQRLTALERTAGIPESAAIAHAEDSLRERVAKLEAAEEGRAEIELTHDKKLYERWVSIAAAMAVSSRHRAAAARAAVLEYRGLVEGGMVPDKAAEQVLRSTIPKSTYAR